MCFEKIEKAKKILLRLLETEEVQQKIRFIVSGENEPQAGTETLPLNSASSMQEQESRKRLLALQSENEALKKDNQQLRSDIEKSHRESSGKERKINDLQRQIDSLQSENENHAEKIRQLESCARRASSLEEKLKKIEMSYQEYQAVFDLFMSLPSSLRKSLKGIFNESDLWSFVICGTQTERLLDFWDFCMRDLKRGKLLDERDKLAQIFDFFLEKINHTLNDTQLYLYQEVKKGAAFDTAQHTATSDSAAVGRVQEVLFPGLVYASSKKILRKSVVVVED